MSDEIPIGPNRCTACGGEYGEHAPDCRIMIHQIQLAPCQFCGSVAKMYRVYDNYQDSIESWWRVDCHRCYPDMTGKKRFSDAKAAADHWNKKT
jgi:hypothetical protein